MKLLLLLSLATFLSAQTIHSSISAYFESKTFKNSVQKEDGIVYGVGADVHYSGSEYKMTYEQGSTNTRQPPLSEDLNTQKLFARYEYNFDKNFALNINYLGVLKDNIAPTDGGVAFGGGCTYTFNKKYSFNFTQFYTDYKDFDIFQSDFTLKHKMSIKKVKVQTTLIAKFITVEDDDSTISYTDNAQNSYLTTGLKVHAKYNGYRLGTGIYIGKRAFAIMQDGFKIQHHAMEFDRTLAIGIGKNIKGFVIRGQYVYQRAVELPVNNSLHVEVSTFRLIANYRL